MSRSADTLITALAVVARGLRSARPAWVRPETWALLSRALTALQRDAVAIVEEHGPTVAHDVLGVARSTLQAWLAKGGWLHRG